MIYCNQDLETFCIDYLTIYIYYNYCIGCFSCLAAQEEPNDRQNFAPDGWHQQCLNLHV